MQKILHVNAHEPYSFAPGRLNATLTDLAVEHLERTGREVRRTTMTEDWDVDQELEKHRWADAVLLQSPVNWMGAPWSFKRYMDHVYSAGMDGRLCDGDGRSSAAPKANYGLGGTLAGRKYMLSLTLNAPREAFENPDEPFFEGRGVDDLFWPMHLNFRFFAMTPLSTFACFDVMKNPEIERDLARFREHLERVFPTVPSEV
jgi:modulator of drug activity B